MGRFIGCTVNGTYKVYQGCQMTCLMGKSTCTQAKMKGSAVMECERGACEQNCVSRGQCGMNCSSKTGTS